MEEWHAAELMIAAAFRDALSGQLSFCWSTIQFKVTQTNHINFLVCNNYPHIQYYPLLFVLINDGVLYKQNICMLRVVYKHTTCKQTGQ